MKRIIYTAIAVCTVVTGALAFRPAENPNLRACSNPNPDLGVCIQQFTLSTTGDTPAPPNTVAYQGQIGQKCGSLLCPRYGQQIFINE